jgi:DNA-binding transcriptional LysR family regulator
VPASPFHPLVPRAIRAFRETYPLVSVRLEERLGGELLELLRSDQIDAAFIRMPHADQEGLVINRLLEEPMLVALPRAHVLARSGKDESPLLLKHLARETFILYGPPGTGLRKVTIEACRAAGFTPRAGQQAPRIASTLSLVAVGLGISLVPASLRHLYVDGVVYRRLNGAIRPKAPLDLASRRGDSSVVVRHFLKLVRQAAKNSRFDESERSRVR